MTTLFNIEEYQNPSQRDWDSVNYDPAWDKPADVTPKPVENSDQKVSAVVEVSDCEEEMQPGISDRWNPLHFGEVPRKVDANGNLTIFGMKA